MAEGEEGSGTCRGHCVIADVYMDDLPLLQLLLLELMHVLLVAPVPQVVGLDHDVEVVLQQGRGLVKLNSSSSKLLPALPSYSPG